MKNKNLQGLNSAEVEQRIKNNQQNTVNLSTTKSVKQIILENSLTLFNGINIFLAILVLTTGSYKNIFFLFFVIANTSIGIFQEIKSKRTIDNLTLLHQTRVKVLRNGEIEDIPQSKVVLGDIIFLESGSQIIVDGEVVLSNNLECDESSLTGESDAILKQDDDKVFSGSYVISGNGYIKATAVGNDSYLAKLTLKTKESKDDQSKLQKDLKKLIKYLTYIIIPVGILLFSSNILKNVDYNTAILSSVAAMIGMIPQGLILVTSVALAIGAVRLAIDKVLTKSIGSIETLARIDVLCLDKTGTLTTNKLIMKELVEVGKDDSKEILAQVIYNINDNNATSQAIKKYCDSPEVMWEYSKVIPFSSKRKYSAIEFNDASYFLGAPDYLYKDNPDLSKIVEEKSNQGYRVLALGVSKEKIQDDVIPNLEIITLIVIEDELRPNAKETLDYFTKQDVTIKIISGDYFKTVEMLAKKADILSKCKAIDMSKVDDDADYQQIAKEYSVFGRVSPEQKKLLVEGLQKNGHTVGMTGDGVNDILALKKADCSIVMNNASDAVKGIADFVLLEAGFESMINVLLEGRRVINNIQRIASLYLTKTVYSIVLAFLYIFIASPFPFQPIQLAPINGMLVGFPSFFLALRPNFNLIKGNFFKNAFKPSLASGATIVVLVLILQIISFQFDFSYLETSTVGVLIVGTVCIAMLHYIAQPINTWIRWMIIGLIAIFVGAFTLFPNFFSIMPLFNKDLAMVYIPFIIASVPLFYFFKYLATKLIKD